MVDDPNQSQDDGFFLEDEGLAAEPSESYSEESAKQSLKEIWRSNPSLKVFAIVVGLSLVVVSFLVFGSDEEIPPQEKYAAVTGGNTITQAPGTAELPPAYEDAVRQATAKRIEDAVATGGSALPTPIARPAERIEAPIQIEDKDPLSEWRREAEARRAERKKEEAQKTAAKPAAVTPVAPPPLPVAQPIVQQTAAATVVQPAAPPPPPPLPTAPTAEQIQAYMAQIQGQVQTVMQTQVPKESTLIKMANVQKAGDLAGINNKANTAQKSAVQAKSQNPTAAKTPPIIMAGTIAYAQTLTEANSDVPGPILAEVASGPLVGGRAIGTFSVADDKLIIQFNRVIKDDKEYAINGIIMDPSTTLTAMSTGVNRHYLQRVFLPAAADFIRAYAQAVSQQDTQVVVNNGTVVSETQRDLSGKEEAFQALNVAGQRVSTFVGQEANRPITVKLAMGTRIGILFTANVYDPVTQANMTQQQQTQQQQLWGQALMNATPAGQVYNAANNVWGSQQQGVFSNNPQQQQPLYPGQTQQQQPLYPGQTQQQPTGWNNLPQMFMPQQQ